MGISKLITLAVSMAVLAASTGQLRKIVLAVHVAQIKLFKESQASNWPKAMLLN
jgi:hypothetical protein